MTICVTLSLFRLGGDVILKKKKLINNLYDFCFLLHCIYLALFKNCIYMFFFAFIVYFYNVIHIFEDQYIPLP